MQSEQERLIFEDEERKKPQLTREQLDQLVWGEDFIKCYMSHADECSHNNNLLNMSGMYCILGQALRNVRIRYRNKLEDGRIHVILVQESGTGKDPAFDFMESVATSAGLTVESLASTTTAGLIGTIEKGGNVIEGPAATADIIGMREASTLFQTAKTEHSSDLIHYMNQIMDKKGHIKKRLAHGTIEYVSHASFFGTTYPPPEGIKYIREGFVARTMFGFRPIGDNHRDEIIDWLIDSAFTQASGDPQQFAGMVMTIRTIMDTISGEYFVLEERDPLKRAVNLVRKVTGEYNDSVREIVKPFITRTFGYINKLAACHAAIDCMSNVIKEKHFVQMLPYLEETWRGTLEFIDKYRPEGAGDRKLTAVEKAIRQLTDNGKREVTLREVLRKTNMTSGDIEVRLRSLVAAEVIKVIPTEPGPNGGRPGKRIRWLGFIGDDKQ